MKKVMLTALMAVLMSVVAAAQGKGNVEFGTNIGFNHSMVSDGWLQSDMGFGINAGVSADYYFSNAWSMKAKVSYDQKGWNNGLYTNEDGSNIANYNLDYITIPLMASYHFGHNRNFYVHFGGYIGLLVSAKETSADTDVQYAFSDSDFGLAYGIGYKFPLNDKLKLNVEYDGQAGGSDIFVSSENDEVVNSRGSINVGLMWLLK